MSYEDHEELVKILLAAKGMVVLSGYPSDVYKPLLEAGWETKTFDVVCSVVGRTARNGLKGTGSAVNSDAQKRTEIIYMSPNTLDVHRESLLVGMEWA
jgi:DNA adenine methylase